MTNLKQEILIVSFFTLVSPIAGWIPSPHHSARGSLPNGGKIWALLVAGSKGYFNYRHQADICHAYQLLRSNGIPESQIITMMYDDVAASPENPTPNTIINHPGGPNVYEGVSIDYSGDDVNSTNFLAVLTGRRDALQGNGSGRVINSGPNDHIFVNFVDHGAPGFLCFPNDELHAKLLEETLQTMFFEKRFGKMVWYVEACESGSMFDDILPDNTNIFVMTAADPRESSYACYYDKLRGTYLGDVFSVNWMEDSDVGNLNKETIHHQFEKVRTKTNSSHVEEYGDLEIGSFPLSSFQGYGAQAKVGVSQRLPAIEDAVSSRDVPLAVLKLQSMSAVDRMAKKKLEHKTWRLLKLRRLLDITMFKFALKVAGGDEVKSTSLLKSTNKLTLSKLDCYEKVVKYFSKRCFKISENPYVLTKMQIFINLCSVSWSNAAIGMKAMDEVCDNDGQQAKIL